MKVSRHTWDLASLAAFLHSGAAGLSQPTNAVPTKSKAAPERACADEEYLLEGWEKQAGGWNALSS